MLCVAGQTILVILSPKDASAVFKDDSSFAFDPFIDMLYRGVANVSAQANAVLWRKPEDGFKSLHPNPKGNVLVHTGNILLHKQLLDPDRLNELTERVLSQVAHTMQWDTFFASSILSSNADTKVVSLHCWCRDTFLGAQSRAFFGDYLNQVEPHMTSIFDAWDLNSWMVTFQYPAVMAQAAIKPRDKLIAALTTYLKAPPEKRSGGVPFVNELLEEELNAGLSIEDSARILLIIQWGLNANAPIITFWLLAYLLRRPDLVAAVRQEISPAMQAFHLATSKANPTLTDVTKGMLMTTCPLLNSAFNEVARISTTGCSVRETSRPTSIGGKTLTKGIKVLIPQRPMLLAQEAFGPNSREVDLTRFAKDRSLERHAYFRPFGGGVTLCSGRVLGRREVLAFVALALWRFDIYPVEAGQEALGINGKPFPRIDEKKPSLGIAKQLEGDDMIVKLTGR
ncbi:MAG: hypothetical protein Q9219_006746 [cf. Caloplaca sp. 3 TL-2023]